MNLRTGVIVILSLIVIASAYNAYAAFQQPATIEKRVITCKYSHYGNFNYTVFLKNNTVYNTSILYPGQGIIFKKILDHMNASYNYLFYCNQPAKIYGNYTVLANIQTDIWEKEFVLVPETSFTSALFYTNFPINFSYFDEIISQINDETGITPRDPTLIITCDITITAKIDNGSINESFLPSLSIPLGRNIIEIPGNLSQSRSDILEESGDEQTSQIGLIEQSNIWSLPSVISFVSLIMLFVFTENATVTVSKLEKMMEKIKKKYGEYIVDVDKKPIFIGTTAIRLKSLEDLIKTSEELGKPILHFSPQLSSEEQHMFYMYDDAVQYEYVLS